MTANRDLSEVIARIQAVIPAESRLTVELERIKQELNYRAPELMHLEWERVAETLYEAFPDAWLPKEWEPWQREACEIFQGTKS